MKINIPIDELLVIVSMHGYYFSKIDDFSTIIHNSKTVFDSDKEVVKIDNESLEITSIIKYNSYYWDTSSLLEPTFYYIDKLKFIQNYVEF